MAESNVVKNSEALFAGPRLERQQSEHPLAVCDSVNESLRVLDKAPTEVRETLVKMGEVIRVFRLRCKENRSTFGQRAKVDSMVLAAIENGLLTPERALRPVRNIDAHYKTRFSNHLTEMGMVIEGQDNRFVSAIASEIGNVVRRQVAVSFQRNRGQSRIERGGGEGDDDPVWSGAASNFGSVIDLAQQEMGCFP